MSTLMIAAIFFALSCYALALAVSLFRLFHGPAAQDRIQALDYMYINGMLMILVLGLRYTSDVFFEAALLVALFGFVGSSAMAKFLLRGEIIE